MSRTLPLPALAEGIIAILPLTPLLLVPRTRLLPALVEGMAVIALPTRLTLLLQLLLQLLLRLLLQLPVVVVLVLSKGSLVKVRKKNLLSQHALRFCCVCPFIRLFM